MVFFYDDLVYYERNNREETDNVDCSIRASYFIYILPLASVHHCLHTYVHTNKFHDDEAA